MDGGGERWLERSAGGEGSRDEKVEEAAMVEERNEECEIFLEKKKKKHLHTESSLFLFFF